MQSDAQHDQVLPYRAAVDDLARVIEARALGRGVERLRELGLAAKTLEGTLTSAAVLGLIRGDAAELTDAGRAFALADPAGRAALLRRALARVEPYRRLLAAVLRRGDATTEAQWVETWWATHGYGSSPSNRAEGAAMLGRLCEHLDLCRYVPGRRGHPTRMEWELDELERLLAAAPERAEVPEAREAEQQGEAEEQGTEAERVVPQEAPTVPASPEPPPSQGPRVAGERPDPAPELWNPPDRLRSAAPSAGPSTSRGEHSVSGAAETPPPPSAVPAAPEQPNGVSADRGHSSVRLVLEGGRVAELRVPARLSSAERRRLLTLAEALTAAALTE